MLCCAALPAGNISPLEVLVNYDTEDRLVASLPVLCCCVAVLLCCCVAVLLCCCADCSVCMHVYGGGCSIHVKVYDPNNVRWEIPQSILPYPAPTSHGALNYAFSYTESPFSAAVTRLSDGEVLVNFTSLQFQDQFLSITTPLGPAPRVYGVGEHGTVCAPELRLCCAVLCCAMPSARVS